MVQRPLARDSLSMAAILAEAAALNSPCCGPLRTFFARHFLAFRAGDSPRGALPRPPIPPIGTLFFAVKAVCGAPSAGFN